MRYGWTCKKCKASIYFIRNKKGTLVPMDRDGKNYHWDSCLKNNNIHDRRKQQNIIKGLI